MIVCACATGTFCTTTIVVVPLRITDRATGSDVTPEVGFPDVFGGVLGYVALYSRVLTVFFSFFLFFLSKYDNVSS